MTSTQYDKLSITRPGIARLIGGIDQNASFTHPPAPRGVQSLAKKTDFLQFGISDDWMNQKTSSHPLSSKHTQSDRKLTRLIDLATQNPSLTHSQGPYNP